ncbi:MAG: maleylpyruvate isomerase family mycothiol-dependent enzyme [Actinobacteria bacterium]|nr:maleylpyruvate isomerase family mycothiol-dependent enzyme [Actinomycetota bacterium]
MTNRTAALPVEAIAPISRDTDAAGLARAVDERLLADLRVLAPADWDRPTECVPWTVADMVGHLIGAAAANASVREMLRQLAWSARHRGEYDGNALDATNDLQVRDHADLSPAERVRRLEELMPAAVAGRMRLPRLLRRVRVPLDTGGSTAEGMPATLGLDHLVDVVYTRDAWLHRVDIARATGRELALDPAVDGRVVADVVREWAARHGRPFRLELTGPAGGRFASGSGGEELRLDAVEFCRVLSGRAPADGLLAWRVLF